MGRSAFEPNERGELRPEVRAFLTVLADLIAEDLLSKREGAASKGSERTRPERTQGGPER